MKIFSVGLLEKFTSEIDILRDVFFQAYRDTVTQIKDQVIASAIARTLTGLQLLETTLEGIMPSAGIRRGLPKLKFTAPKWQLRN